MHHGYRTVSFRNHLPLLKLKSLIYEYTIFIKFVPCLSSNYCIKKQFVIVAIFDDDNDDYNNDSFDNNNDFVVYRSCTGFLS